MFSLKIFKAEYYQGRPLKEFDVTYSKFRGKEVTNVPVIRIFGTTPSGQKACVHVHGVLPYLSVPYSGPVSEVPLYSQQLAFAIDKALNIARARSASTTQHVHDIHLFSAIPFYGYHREKRHFLRIYFYNPANVKKAAELLLSGAIMGTVLQPHEAHIPYTLQFFIDRNLAGMELLSLARFKFRSLPPQNQRSVLASPSCEDQLWDLRLLNSELLVSLPRQTTCELELDCHVEDFVARQEDPKYKGMNPGLANIWEDEKCRRRARQDNSQLAPPLSQDRGADSSQLNEDCHLWHKWQTLQRTLPSTPTANEASPTSISQNICSSPEAIVDESQLQAVLSSSQVFNTQSSQDRSLLEAVLELVSEEPEDDETPPPDDEDRTTAEMSLCIWYQDDQAGAPPPSEPSTSSIPQLDGSQDEPLAPSPGKPKHLNSIHLHDQNKSSTEREASNSLERNTHHSTLVRTKASRKMFPPLPLVTLSHSNSRVSISKSGGRKRGRPRSKRRSKQQEAEPGTSNPLPSSLTERLSPPPEATSSISPPKASSSHALPKVRKYASLSLTKHRQYLADKKKRLLEKCPKGLILPSLSAKDLEKLGKEVISVDQTAGSSIPNNQAFLLGKVPSSPGLKMRFKLTKSSKGTNFRAQLLEDQQPSSNYSSCNESDQSSPQVPPPPSISPSPPSSPPLPLSPPPIPSPSAITFNPHPPLSKSFLQGNELPEEVNKQSLPTFSYASNLESVPEDPSDIASNVDSPRSIASTQTQTPASAFHNIDDVLEQSLQDTSVIYANKPESLSQNLSDIIIVESSQSAASPRTQGFAAAAACQDSEQSFCSSPFSTEFQGSTIIDFSEMLDSGDVKTNDHIEERVKSPDPQTPGNHPSDFEGLSKRNSSKEEVLPPAKRLKTRKSSRKGPKKQSKLPFKVKDSLIANETGSPDASDHLKDVLWKLSLYSPIKQSEKSYISTLDPHSPTQLIPTPPQYRPPHIYLPKFAQLEENSVIDAKFRSGKGKLPVPVYETISPPNSPERPSENYQCNMFTTEDGISEDEPRDQEMPQDELVPPKTKGEEEENPFAMLNLMLSDIEKETLKPVDEVQDSNFPDSVRSSGLASPLSATSQTSITDNSSHIEKNKKSNHPESPILFDDSIFEFSKESFCDNQAFFGTSQFSSVMPDVGSAAPPSPVSAEDKHFTEEGSPYIDIFSSDPLGLSSSNPDGFDPDNLSLGFSQKKDDSSNSSLPNTYKETKPRGSQDSNFEKDELSLTLENEIKKLMSPSRYSKSIDIFEGDSLFSLNKEDDSQTIQEEIKETKGVDEHVAKDSNYSPAELLPSSLVPDRILTPESQASGSIYSFYNYSTFNEAMSTPMMVDSGDEAVPSPQSQSSRQKPTTPGDSAVTPSRTASDHTPTSSLETPMAKYLNKTIQETSSPSTECVFHSTPLSRRSRKRKSKRYSQKSKRKISSLAIIPEISPILPKNADATTTDDFTKRSLNFESPKEEVESTPELQPQPKVEANFSASSLKLVEPRDHSGQCLTVMSLEVHVATRRDLKPDPALDSAMAFLYSVYCREKWHHGLVAVDFPPGELSSQDDLLHRLLRAASCTPLPTTYVPDETALIEELSQIVLRFDPELLCGYEVQGASWGFFLQRAVALGLDLAHKLSRVPQVEDRATHIDEDQYGADHSSEIHIAGRVMLNVWRLMRKEVALNSYTLENVLYHVLRHRVPLYPHRQLTAWYLSPSTMWRVVGYYHQRCQASIRLLLHFDVLGRTSELARVFGIQFHEVLTRGSQFRVESMMLRCTKLCEMVAVSPSHSQRAAMMNPEVIPLVMEPSPPGYFHDPVAVLDFQSLYPSIIIAHNFCFSTCLGHLHSLLQPLRAESIKFGCSCLNVPQHLLKDLDNRVNISPNGVVFVKPSVRTGVLPQLLEDILNTRIMVKNAMKEYKDQKALYRMLDSRQLALKLISNVTYGYTAANFSGRMPLVELGESIVSKARQTLERAIKFVNSMHKWKAKVVYGDTDSLFVHLPGRTKEEAFVIGQQIADAITSQNPKPVKLKFEKVYQPCILQTKKHYAGFKYETLDQKEPEFESKGIETIRRDSCPAASKILGKALQLLFSSRGDVAQVKSLVQNFLMRLPSASLQDFVFAKEYRGQSGYRPGSCVPSLEIARRRLRVDPCSEPRTKERVPYAIVYGAPGLPLIQLVREPAELVEDPGLKLNLKYYISRVILPPLQRAFQLMGHNVNSWYQEIPPVKFRVRPAPASSTRGQVTLSQWCRPSQCLVCERPAASLCDQCRSSPHHSIFSLVEQISEAEKLHHKLTQVCQSCTAQRGEIGCESLACPIYFRRNRLIQDTQHLPLCYSQLEQTPWPR